MTDEDVAAKPLIGLGRLRLGMTADEVAAVSSVFGTAGDPHSVRMSDAHIEDTLNTFAAGMSEEEMKSLRELYAEQGPPQTLANQHFDSGLVSLEYDGGILISITAYQKCSALNLDGLKVFEATPLDVMRHLEKLNGEPGLYIHNSAFFERILVYVDGFTAVSSERGVRIVDDSGDSDAPTFMLRSVSYFPNDISDQLRSYSFLKQ